jgi:hypothetical protein
MLPSNWDGVTIEQYNEIKEAPERNTGLFSLGAWIIAVLLDKEVEEIEDELSAFEIAKLFRELKWILGEPRGKLLEEVELDGISYKLKPISKTTYGEAIDVFSLLEKEGAIEKTAAIFYRRWVVNEWGRVVFEPRGYDLKEREEKLKSFPVGSLCEVLNSFKEYNKKIRENYAELFEEPEEEEGEEREPWEEEEEETKEREGFEDAKEKARREAQKKHGWFLIALKLAGGDATKLEEVFKLPFAYVMNILAIEHETKQ